MWPYSSRDLYRRVRRGGRGVIALFPGRVGRRSGGICTLTFSELAAGHYYCSRFSNDFDSFNDNVFFSKTRRRPRGVSAAVTRARRPP